MVFCHADETSVQIIKDTLNHFSNSSGLAINQNKSRLYLSGVNEDIRGNIQRELGIQADSLAINYLGLPLITTRLTSIDCIPLL